MTRCPRCNGPGGVVLFTSVAPCPNCDKGSASTNIYVKGSWVGCYLLVGTKVACANLLVEDGAVAKEITGHIVDDLAGKGIVIPPSIGKWQDWSWRAEVTKGWCVIHINEARRLGIV